MPPIDRPVDFTDYAVGRMRRRNVDFEDVAAALEAPGSRHRHRKDGRSDCWTRIPNLGQLLVVYRKFPDRLLVINVIWD